MEYTFAEVHGRESILIPGTSIIKESLEELGALKKYMTENHVWILGQFRTRYAFSLIASSLSSSSSCFQARLQIEATHPCRWYCEN